MSFCFLGARASSGPPLATPLVYSNCPNFLAQEGSYFLSLVEGMSE